MRDELLRDCPKGNFIVEWTPVNGSARKVPHPALKIIADAEPILRQLEDDFGYGTMTSPSIRFARPGARDFSLTIESVWSARNFSPAGQISDSDQRRRSPGDSACRNVGGNHIEKWPVNDS